MDFDDLDDRIRAARPDPEPSTETVGAHRAALEGAMVQSGNTGSDQLSPIGSRSVILLDAEPRVPKRSVFVAAVAAVCLVVVGTVAGIVLTGDEALEIVSPAQSTEAEDGTATPATDDTSPPPAQETVALTCGAELPSGIELPGLGVGLADGPLPGSEEALDGQLVKHATGDDLSVEFRWPPRDRLERGVIDSELLTTGVGGYLHEQGRVVELFVNEDFETLIGGPDGLPDGVEPLVRLTNVDYSGENPGCMFLEMRLIDGSGAETSLVLGLDSGIDDEGNVYAGGVVRDNDPVVVKTVTVEAAPAEALLCEGGVGDVPPSVDAAIDGAPVRSTALDALIAYLSGPDGETKYQSGYVEFLASDGSVTYAHPIGGGGDGYVTIIQVDPTDGAWSATQLIASGC